MAGVKKTLVPKAAADDENKRAPCGAFKKVLANIVIY